MSPLEPLSAHSPDSAGGDARGTLDRDVRLTPDQITYATVAVRKRIRELGRSIAAADANHRAGGRVQHNVYDRHVHELSELCALRDSLDAAQANIQRRIRDDALGMA